MSHDTLEDVKAARRGDARALDRIWARNRRWVAVVLAARAPRGFEIEDLLQETALAMVRGIRDLEEPRALRGWLRRIALNAANAAARRPRPPGELEIEPPSSPLPLPGEISEDLLSGLLTLPPSLREPLLLRALEGMTQREIAAVLELSEEAVESRLARGRRRLREALARAELDQGVDR